MFRIAAGCLMEAAWCRSVINNNTRKIQKLQKIQKSDFARSSPNIAPWLLLGLSSILILHFGHVLVLRSSPGVRLGWFGHFRKVGPERPTFVFLCTEIGPTDLIWPA